jgi:CubicO group peptidase (beta-lactamase class C family)
LEVHGLIAPGFEPVRDAFACNLRQRGEVGGACAVVVHSEKVVDIWGGLRDWRTGEGWEADTLALLFSTTKGLAATAMAMAHARGLLLLDEPVARYWPEFAQAGKERITVRQLFTHRAGLPVLDARLNARILADMDSLAVLLARQRPRWEPGTRQGYHAITLGLYQNELFRRIDPRGRTIGRFLREEVNPLLGADLLIGLPSEVPESRIAATWDFHPLRAVLHWRNFPLLAMLAMIFPWSLIHRSLLNPLLSRPGDYARPPMRNLEIASVNGLSNARSLALLFGELATGGRRLGLTPRTFEEMIQRPEPPPLGRRDIVVWMPLIYSPFAFFKPVPKMRFGTSPSAFGSPGAGGTFAFAEPTLGLGYAYSTCKMGFCLFNDPREKSLRDALMACLRKQS